MVRLLAAPKALRAACSAKEELRPLGALGGGGAGAEGARDGLSYLYGSYSSSSSCAREGGGGGVDRDGARGAAEGGGGGGAGGTAAGGGGGGALGVDEGGGGGGAGGALPGTGGARAGEAGGGGAIPEGFREEGGGMGGFFPTGGGGLGFMPMLDATEEGLESFSAPKAGRAPGTGGAGGAPGGFGAAPRGGFGTELRVVSGSDRYGALLWSAPVFTPPAFLSFGMPPANKPPNCGAVAMAFSPPPVSLLLLARFPPGGTGGASPGGAGGLPMPGTGGAPPMGGALGPSLTLPTIGADLSLTCVTFFNFMPFPMSDNSAPCDMSANQAMKSCRSCSLLFALPRRM